MGEVQKFLGYPGKFRTRVVHASQNVLAKKFSSNIVYEITAFDVEKAISTIK